MTDNTQLAARITGDLIAGIGRGEIVAQGQAMDLFEELRAALTQSPTCREAERWQPIETAPKELGAGVLAWDESCADEPYIASWTRTGWFDGVVFRAPVAWQPLPEPPATAIRGADQ